MYTVIVVVEFEDGTTKSKTFNYWDNATLWINSLANDGDILPEKVTMKIMRD